jgi:hypothetical protein
MGCTYSLPRLSVIELARLPGYLVPGLDLLPVGIQPSFALAIVKPYGKLMTYTLY